MSARALLGGVAAALAAAAFAAPQTAPQAAPPAAEGPLAGEAAHGRTVFVQQCSGCHGVNAQGGLGPNLHGVTARVSGGLPGYGYSEALTKAAWRWDDAHLDRYLADPQAAIPGTAMPVKVEDAGQRRELIAYLHTLAPPGPAAEPAPRPLPAAVAAPRGDTVVFGDYRLDAPGVRHRVTLADLPAPYATASAGNGPGRAARPPGGLPQVPAGVRVTAFAEGLQRPRALRTAPNGDVFVAEQSGRVTVLRAADGAGVATQRSVFAEGLTNPFGVLFYPAGPDPQWVYIAETNRVRRFPYRNGDTRARGAPQVIVPRIADTTSDHVTRDLALSPDGRRIFLSVGSSSNVADAMEKKPLAEAVAYDRVHGYGAAWGPEADRAEVVSFTPEGGDRRVYATGLRNCVGLAVQPARGALWCSTNERDELGDNLVPDYVTSVREGGFYGWPWWYMGNHEDPRLKGDRPDLAGHVITPDVLLQPHSASLQMAFYTGAMFPQWRGSILAAEHGSWNRALRTGYKLIRIPVGADGRATGGYEDVMTGFVLRPRPRLGPPRRRRRRPRRRRPGQRRQLRHGMAPGEVAARGRHAGAASRRSAGRVVSKRTRATGPPSRGPTAQAALSGEEQRLRGLREAAALVSSPAQRGRGTAEGGGGGRRGHAVEPSPSKPSTTPAARAAPYAPALRAAPPPPLRRGGEERAIPSPPAPARRGEREPAGAPPAAGRLRREPPARRSPHQVPAADRSKSDAAAGQVETHQDAQRPDPSGRPSRAGRAKAEERSVP